MLRMANWMHYFDWHRLFPTHNLTDPQRTPQM